ncbi:hypothetical protein WICMUC_003269 [Wickerhamomyces mucosus]|uniref:Cytochrome b5 heme-binding domain-containing protein n=1 Tax=Wickerhamomyces mucosus TaxID=1378264 RepID=A0A9P8PLW7_9ASCO|nr:hypothetical protein WICMUC_003269 [Wickerhamomyces mucosus]
MDANRLRGLQPPPNPIKVRLEAQRTAFNQKDKNPTITKKVMFPKELAPPSIPISESTFPLANSAQRSTNGRSKVMLEPGHSPLDWANLNSSGKNLRGIESHQFPIKVTKELLKQHIKVDDCWTVLGNKVYNITSYVKFHPGGVEEIMKCAGKDGTSLFMKYHAWVNYERMLENCFIGFYIK